MATVAVLLHDGYYGCGTGAGVSNRRFLEVLIPGLAPGCRLVVMPVRVAEGCQEYDRDWHQAVAALVGSGGGTVAALDNGAGGQSRFGSRENWRRLAVSAEERIRAVGLGPGTLVIAFDVPFLELAGRLGRTAARVVLVPRGSLALYELSRAELVWERDCYRRLVAAGARVGLISAFMGRHLVTSCGVSPRAMVPVYDGTTAAEWSEEVSPIAVPELAARGFLLTMGRAHPYKGFDDLLDALQLLRAQGEAAPHLVMAAVTEDEEPSGYQRHLQRRIAAERLDVTLVTRFSRGVRSLIGHPALRAVVVPSRVEPFGRIPMEVYSHPRRSGVPVVAAAAGGLAEVVIEGRTGYVCPAACPEGLARAIVRALSGSREEHGRLRTAGRRLIAERYSYKANVEGFLRVVAPAGTVQGMTGSEVWSTDGAGGPVSPLPHIDGAPSPKLRGGLHGAPTGNGPAGGRGRSCGGGAGSPTC